MKKEYSSPQTRMLQIITEDILNSSPLLLPTPLDEGDGSADSFEFPIF